MEWYFYVLLIIVWVILSHFDEKRAIRSQIESERRNKENERLEKERQSQFRNFVTEWIENEGKQYANVSGYPVDWKIRRQYVLIRDNFSCIQCGRYLKPLFSDTDLDWKYAFLRSNYENDGAHRWKIGYVCEKAHVHHIMRVRDGGTHEPENLQTLCESCHTKQDGHKGLHRKVKTSAYYKTYTNNNKLKIARIVHNCDICERKIAKGEKYFGGSYVEKGSRSRFNRFGNKKESKICIDCFKSYDYRSRHLSP